jgi:hypothetical protein
MEKYFVADSYKGYERIGEPYKNAKGALYTKVKCKCDRCHKGIYVTRVENGQPVPHPAFGGVCLKCGGKGFIYDEVRLYTEKEYKAMEDRKERERIKKEKEIEERMQADFANNKSKWLEENGFDEEEYTYIYFPNDSYDVKDQLKSDGFKFNPNLFWHRDNAIGYEDKVIKIAAAAVVEFSAWGKGLFLSTAKTTIQDMMKEARPHVESEWAAAEKERVRNVKAVLDRVSGFSGAYGWTNVYRFLDEKKHIFVWFTSKDIGLEKGALVTLTGTVKKLQEYDGEKQTVLTRCSVLDRTNEE